jgi:hypothetical protein
MAKARQWCHFEDIYAVADDKLAEQQQQQSQPA